METPEIIEYSTKFPLATVEQVKRIEPLLYHYKVAKTSMGKKKQKGFLEVFLETNGSEEQLCEKEYKSGVSWMMKREKFLTVYNSRWKGKDIPMKIILTFVAWGFVPKEIDEQEMEKELEGLQKMNSLVLRK